MEKCNEISVDCVENLQKNINNGEPEYIGFDFYVEKKDTEIMKEYIIDILNEFEVPILSIYLNTDIDCQKKQIYDKDRIYKSIKENADYIKFIYNNTKRR